MTRPLTVRAWPHPAGDGRWQYAIRIQAEGRWTEHMDRIPAQLALMDLGLTQNRAGKLLRRARDQYDRVAAQRGWAPSPRVASRGMAPIEGFLGVAGAPMDSDDDQADRYAALGVPERYGCQFGECPWSFDTPAELSEHYASDHGARR